MCTHKWFEVTDTVLAHATEICLICDEVISDDNSVNLSWYQAGVKNLIEDNLEYKLAKLGFND